MKILSLCFQSRSVTTFYFEGYLHLNTKRVMASDSKCKLNFATQPMWRYRIPTLNRNACSEDNHAFAKHILLF